MKTPLVSVIIPAFNVDKYIIDAVNSVLEQTYKNIEIVIVNDGSTDNTLEIIEKLAKENKNIIFFSQRNKGISSARNLGLSKASGEYISFLDSDDFIDPTFIEVMLEKNLTNNSDVVFCLNKTIDRNNNVILSNDYKDINDVAVNYINFDYFDICCLLIKREFLLMNEFDFDENLIVGEDVLFILKCICKSSFLCVPEYLYSYVYRDTSIMNKKWFVKDYINEIKAWDTIQDYMKNHYYKKNRPLLIQKINTKIMNLKISFMWKLMSSKKYDELYGFMLKTNLNHEDEIFLRKKILLKLKIIKSKNKFYWFLARFFFSKRKDILE